MNTSVKNLLKIASLCALAAFAVWCVFNQIYQFRHRSKADARVWFYDQSAKQLYAVPAGTIPPDRGISGPSGDGVRAVVITFRGETNDASHRRIAYLETCTPKLKQLLERIHRARKAGRIDAGPMPASGSMFLRSNTLVKRVTDSTWSPVGSPQARRIVSEWRSWRGPQGQAPVICIP